MPASPRRGRHRRTCSFCSLHPAVVRDLETDLVWCEGCATDLIHAGDPIEDYQELDDDLYAGLLQTHGRGRFTSLRPRPPRT
ncbi:hypothetical protein K7472_17840 [Streptomyces sp. PTM05]|uniref:Transcription factor zinc-finger domain-containing protein n=1 Tax=Streptantibioticus parmotrematis TaxID=2873249 RepID=A0ABS7QVM2_9ACTN|nr:hypothetical protein [Streptantibioticus parmotrematis]MBY8886714.1 hypothetical protein [Streptantibioticus parmotrematis]